MTFEVLIMTRVLVIDDDKSVCTAIETLLRRQGYMAVVAGSGDLGTETVKNSNFDVIMIDIFMPGMDGLETIKGFRERAPATPIVAMSGFRFRNSMSPAPDFLGMASELGAACCLRKPFRPQELIAAIQTCLSISGSSSAAEV